MLYEVITVGRGRSRDAIRPFFKQLGSIACEGIKAVALDCSAAYGNEIKDHCPNARIVYDLFHFVARYGREVIDRVRVDEANRLRNDPRERKVVKGTRWLLLKNTSNIQNPKDKIRLQDLLSANKSLAKVYILKLIGTVISGFLRFRVKIRFFPRTTTVFAPRTTNPIRIFRQRRLQEV